MKKRIIALLALVAMMATMLTVPVGATLEYEEDFSTLPASGKLDDLDEWTPYTPTASTIGFNDGAAYFNVPKELHHLNFQSMTRGSDVFFKFDIKYATNNSQLTLYLYNGEYRIWGETVNGHDEGKWNTYIAHLKNETNGTKYYIYKRGPFDTRELAAQSNGAYTLVKTGDGNPHTAAPYINIQQSRNGTGNAFWIDNITICSGGFSINKTEFKVDSTKINSVSNVTAGNLAADISISDASTMIDATSKTVKAILVTFDQDGKMVGCGTEDKDIKGGVTSIAPEFAISAADAVAIANNGYIATYIWSGMQPIGEPIDLGTAPITSTHSDN